MPKKTFRSSNSTVVIKRNKFGSITRHKVVSKRPKLILIDEKNENNWKYLKSELGYKTDSLFLEYLLNLAQRDLNLFRPKKRLISNENDESLNRSWNGSNEKETDSFAVFKTKSRKSSSPAVENEKKAGTKKLVSDGREEFEDGRLIDSNERKLTGNGSDGESTKNVKTETAKDFDLDCISLGDRNRGQSIDELSSFKDLNLHNSSDGNFFSQCKSSTEDLSSQKTKNLGGQYKKGNSKEMKRREEEERECGRRRKGRNDLKLASKSDSDGADGRKNWSVNTRLCRSERSSLTGNCPEDSSGRSNGSEVRSRENSNGLPYGDGNVYDFDESEREIHLDGNSRWCHKLLRANESTEEGSVSSGRRVTELKNLNLAGGVAGDGNDSDSSSSGLKLRIDESFGENISFAESSLPDHLTMKVRDEEHGQSVFSRSEITKSTHFGPLIGQKVREMDIPDDFDMKYIWEVNTADGVAYLSTKDAETSNWLRFLRPANSRESANLISCVKEDQLYFISIREIGEGEELLYWMDDIHSAWSKKKLEKKNCGGCNIQFTHPLYYRKHCMIFHDPSCSLTIRKYHCKICGLAVLGKEKIMKHAAEMHQGKGAYQCQYCHKFFLRLNYLEMHRTYGCSKNPQRSRPLCDLCGRKFCQPQKLKVHIKRMHSDMAEVLKDFQCKSCLKILGSRAALQRHLKEVHNKDIIGACTCDRCGKMFQNKSNLKIHMLTHSGVKPFKCQQTDCTAAFTTKQCLQFHYKKVHGFTDDFIPKIERSIAYTFDAYSGGTVSEPTRCQSPKHDDGTSPPSEQRECCLDLSLVASPVENMKGKEKVQFDGGISSVPGDESKHRYLSREEKSPVCEKQEDGITGRRLSQDSTAELNQGSKMIVSKGSKKWIVSDCEKSEDRFRSIFRSENTTSLLVEAAINAAEKDVTEKPIADKGQELENHQEMYPMNQYGPTSPGIGYESSEKKVDDYGKPESPEDAGKKNFSDFLRCNSILRINTSPASEIPKDYNVASMIRDHETESFPEIEIQDYRNRDSIESYKESENFHDHYRSHELYRAEKIDFYRSSGESDARISSVDYRDFEISNETYRNLATNLEKYRSADVYRLRSEGYETGIGYGREAGDERDGEAQNLSLKEKSFQCETLEELARIGRDNPGFECLLVGDSANGVGSQSFGSAGQRGIHGMLSPRSYHPTYESESVDLSVPRPSYSSSPIYTLDLTPTRVELPTRHLDFRTHLGLSPHRFPSSRLPGLSNGGQLSPTGYSVYSSPYVAPPARHSPTSQFQPYTSLYY